MARSKTDHHGMRQGSGVGIRDSGAGLWPKPPAATETQPGRLGYNDDLAGGGWATPAVAKKAQNPLKTDKATRLVKNRERAEGGAGDSGLGAGGKERLAVR